MRRLLLVLACLAALPARAEEADPIATIEHRQQELFERTAPAVVLISQKGGFGSGFFLTADGLALTNAHVVGGAREVDVVLHDGRKLQGNVVEKADGVDLALVQVPVSGVPFLVLDELSDVRIGSWVASVGHGEGAIWTFNTGMVSNIHPQGSQHPVIQTQIPLNPGNSGGPVIDRRGRVIGIVTAGIKESNSINFAIRSDVALRSLPKLTAAANLLVITAPAGIPVFVDGAMLGQGPRVVVPAKAKSYEVFVVVGGKMQKKNVTFPAVRTVSFE